MSEMDIDSAGSSKPRPIELTDSDGDDKDPDPIVASYDVYTNPPLADNRKLLVLQHPNKQGTLRHPYPVSGVRLKNRSGFVEVDVPISYGQSDYDKDKGLRWGSALSRSTAAKNGGSHGLAAGFGVAAPTRGAAGGGAGRGGGAKRPDDLEREISMMDWNEAVRQDKVLRTQTLGGQLAVEKETNCRWMIGVFKGDQLHLTPATSLIHLRPQLHHLDALTEQERLNRPREGAGAGAGPGQAAPAASGGASKEGASANGAAAAAAAAAPAAARAIHMSIKSASSGDGEAGVDTMIDRLRKVQTEKWIHMKYEDDDSDKAWTMFNSSLIYSGARPARQTRDVRGKDKGKGKGKGKEEEGDTDADADAEALLKYKTQWTEEEFLRAVSGLEEENQQGDGDLAGDDELAIKAEVINQTPLAGVKKAAAPAKGKGKAAATPAASTAAASTSAPRRAGGARGKSVAFKE
ncbi:hypothetical protein M426DRAFT_321485 [Hypoxylon sp. CI-4A]|nr:hypothetical protein M426DRAFT_321485 [Hypoxylon sp. CI-4A]